LERDIDIAVKRLREGASVAIARNGRLLASREGKGVLPLVLVLRQVGDDARGASVADKVVGKSVAMIAADAGVIAIHAALASEAAVAFLEPTGIEFSYDRRVEFIKDMSGMNMCPIEKKSVGREDAHAVRLEIEAMISPANPK
jgi:hypothetical protein